MTAYQIRKTAATDLDAAMGIYAQARAQMAAAGNPDQWGDEHPPRALVAEDIATGRSYVCTAPDGGIAAIFYFAVEEEPTYAHINGAWLNSARYGVIHRIARAPGAKGAATACLEWCLTQCNNLRIDTHAANAPMLRLLEKLGYKKCGIIRLGLFDEAAWDERIAYQKVKND